MRVYCRQPDGKLTDAMVAVSKGLTTTDLVFVYSLTEQLPYTYRTSGHALLIRSASDRTRTNSDYIVFDKDGWRSVSDSEFFRVNNA